MRFSHSLAVLFPVLAFSYFKVPITFAAGRVVAPDIPTPGAPGIGDTVQPVSGNGGYNVERYWLEMRFTSDLSGYISTTTTNARATQALSRFNLDLKGNEVQAVTVNGKTAKWARDGEELQITPPTPIHNGSAFSVRVQVKGKVPDYTTSRLLHPEIFGIMRSGDWVQTVNQPCGAHGFAALDDAPSQKAPATITIVAPSRLNSISNGELTGTWTDKANSGYTVRQFESREKLATELLQIGVGPFTVIRNAGPHGITLRYAIPTAQLKQIEPQLKVVPEVINFLEARLGTFPLKLYGLYVTPIGSPIETQSVTLVSTREVLPSPFKDEDNGGDVVIAHEASHEYFGNTVSPRRWSDTWLNEGHATFYENVWGAIHGGRTMEERMRREYGSFTRVVKHSGPVAAPRRSAYDDADLAPYDDLPYVGGAVTLYALQQEVGKATFEKIERAWLSEYRNSVADTSDFIALANRVAGRDLGPFLRAWLYGQEAPPMPGHPDWKSPRSREMEEKG